MPKGLRGLLCSEERKCVHCKTGSRVSNHMTFSFTFCYGCYLLGLVVGGVALGFSTKIDSVCDSVLWLSLRFYSMYGHVATLAHEIKKGAEEVEGVEATLFQVSLLKKSSFVRECSKIDPCPSLSVGAAFRTRRPRHF